ncbi:MAG TPA: MsnO8 family LLM class oxidoreductase [Enterococcus sp.]|nr:MsnO8 family LLM class oxidoreductase [Enterococcus sp.]
MGIKLSLLDQSIVYEGETATSTLAKTVAFAQKADILGFDTFFVSEHHLIKELAGASPEVLIGYLLASTKKIKVGAAGIMLQHYIPFKVAESFSVLHHLAPERVVLGIGKAQGGKDEAVEVLQRDFIRPAPSFEEKFSELAHFIRNDFPEGHPYAAPEYTLEPQIQEKLAIELLGGSQESAELATQEQAGLIYPYFGNADEEALAKTRQAYQAKETFKIAVVVYITEDETEAAEYLEKQASYTVVFNTGKRLNFADQATADEYAQQHQAEEAQVIQRQVGAFVGSAAQVKADLLDFSERFNTEHFVIHTPGVPYDKKHEIIQALANELKGE